MEINICLQGLNNSSTLLGVCVSTSKIPSNKWHKGDTFFRLCKSWLHDFLFKKNSLMDVSNQYLCHLLKTILLNDNLNCNLWVE